MKHRTLDELATEAHVTSVGAESMRAVRRQRLERLASLLEVHEGALRLFSGMEYLPKSHRILMSVDDSPLTIAYHDPDLRRQGLTGDRICDAMSFFDLKSDEFSSVFLRHLPFGDGRQPIAL
jgi:hypothetical protein